jgi:adenylate cyclase
MAVQVLALQDYPVWLELLHVAAPEEADWLPANVADLRAQGGLHTLVVHLRQIVQRDPGLPQRLAAALSARTHLSAERRHVIERLIDVYAGSELRYLNYYGPPGTVTTYNMDRLLAPSGSRNAVDDMALRDKIVFVGYAEHWQYVTADHHPTPYSSSEGIELAGVEIAATATANLLDGTALRLPAWYWHGTLGFGLTLFFAAAAALARPWWGIGVAAAGLVAYTLLALLAFSAASLWLPLALPALQGLLATALMIV